MKPGNPRRYSNKRTDSSKMERFLNNQTMTFTPEQLRKHAQEMLRHAEQLENGHNKRCYP